MRAEGGFAYGVIGADIHVFGDGVPLYVLENWRPPPQADPDFLREVPSRMLNARFAVVEFTGRDEELAELRHWRETGPRLAVRWLHAPGGQGKSRLADQFARQSVGDGWKVVVASHGPGTVLPPPGSQDLRLDGFDGLLLIIDYADRWPLAHLTWLLSNALLHQPGVPTRVLMLARSLDVWPAIRAALANQQVGLSTQPLPGLADGTGERERMFTVARDSFAAGYGVDDASHIRPPSPLTQPDLGLVLALHMAALVAVDAHVRGVRPPQDTVGLTIYLLDREHAHWTRRYGDETHDLDPAARPYRTPPAVMNRAVYLAALTGALPRPIGAEVVSAAQPMVDAARVLADHAVCYPPADPARDTVLEPLYPDRLAEDFVALTLPGHSCDYPAQDWAPPTALELLARTPGDPPQIWSRRSLTVLAAAAERWPHVGPEYLYPLLRGDPRLAVEAGNPVLAAVAALPDVPADVLSDIAAAFPDDVPADVAVGYAAVQVRRAPHRLSDTDDPVAHAQIHSDLSRHLSTLGRDDESMRSMNEAVAIWRRLVESAGDDERSGYERYLAQGLNNLSNRLAAHGRRAEAIGAALEAVGINRRLVEADPAGGDRFHLAVTLATLGTHLSGAGRRTDAFAAMRESAELYQELAAADPSAYGSGLAVALTNLGSVLDDEHNRQEALEVTRWASGMWRELAASNPAAYEPDLALSLFNLASLSRDLGQMREGLAAASEAAQILRRLAEHHPRAHEEAFAVALDVMRDTLTGTGALAEALTVASEAADLRRRRFATASTTHNAAALVRALRGLATVLDTTGQWEPARAAEAEAAEVERLLDEWLRSVGFVSPLAPPEVARRRRRSSVERAAPEVVAADRPRPDAARAWAGWTGPRDLDKAARRLARAKDWPGLWELTRSVSIVDACRLVRRIPLGRWSPSDEAGRSLARRLGAMDHRHAAGLADAAAARARRTLPSPFYWAPKVSFAPGRAAMAIQDFHPDTREESISVHDLSGSTSHQVYRGPAEHLSIGCLGPDEVVAIRSSDHRSGTPPALVSYTPGKATHLARLPAVAPGRLVPTPDGFILGLGLAPIGYVFERGEAAREVNLSTHRLWRVSLATIDPTGTRLAVSDGTTVAVTDVRLQVIATGEVPDYFDEVNDVAFAAPGRLFISGTGGGLLLWQVDGAKLRPLASTASPRLEHLFAVPAWGVVGGWDLANGQASFYDATTLAATGTPPPIGTDMRLHGFAASPDGRYVLYSGFVTRRRRWSGVRSVALLEDLHAPAAWLRRPLASITSADLATLDDLLSAPAGLGDLRPLLELVAAVAEYRTKIQ